MKIVIYLQAHSVLKRRENYIYQLLKVQCV